MAHVLRRQARVLVAVFSAGLLPATATTASAPVRALAADPYSSAVLADNPVSYWRFQETSGTTATDQQGLNAGDIIGGVTLGQPGINAGETAYGFDGSSGRVDLTTSPNLTRLNPGSQITVEAWIKVGVTLSSGKSIVRYRDDVNPDSGYGLILTGSAAPQFYTASSSNTTYSVTGPTSVNDGQWHHVVGVKDAAGVRVYVDAVLVGSVSGTLPIYITGTPDAAIGEDGTNLNPNFYFPGSIAEVAVYGQGLSPSQVAGHYVASGNALPPQGSPITKTEVATGDNFCWRCYAQRTVNGSRAEPVNTLTGTFYERYTDLSIPGRGLPIAFTRTYSSARAASSGPLGYGWTDGYAMSLGTDSSGNATITGPDGSQTIFSLSGTSYSAPPRAESTLTKGPDGSYTFTQARHTTYTFSPQGQLTKEQDLNGYTTTLAYNGSGQLVSITDPSNRSVTVSYTGDNVTGLTDPMGRTVSFAYGDGAGNLTSVTDMNGGLTKFTYDASHLLLTITDPRGNVVTTNHYDASQRADWQTDGLNRKTTFAYSGTPLTAAGGSTTTTDPKGNVSVDQYINGERTAITRGYGTPQSATWQYRYDPGSLGPSVVVDPNGHATSYTYDAAGNRTGATDPLGRTTTSTYDSLNDLTSMTDPKGVTTTFTYDSGGNLLSRSTPLVGSSQTQTTTLTYGDAAHPGDVTAVTDPAGKVSHTSYDSNGDVVGTTDPVGDMTTMTYNAVGWLLTTVSPRGNATGGTPSQYTTTYSYADPTTGATDEFGDVRAVTDPLGDQTIKSYDADRNVVSTRDPDGNLTQYTFDAANEQTGVTRADGTTLHTDYFADGSVQDQVNGAGNTTSYAYDPLGYLTSVTDPLGNVISYVSDAVGDVLTRTDPGGSCTATPKVGCTTHTYDAANQLTAVTYSDGVTPNVTGISYDADGQRTAMTDGTGTSSWTWDSLHRLTGYANGTGAAIAFGYDLRGTQTSIVYPGSHTVTQGFDDAGRLTSVQDWLGNTTTFGYDPDSDLTSETSPTSGSVDSFTFDSVDRLTSISDTSGATSLFTAVYTRDAKGQVTADTSASTGQSSYRYTALNQVCYAGVSNATACTSAPPASQPFTYDAADNLTQAGTTQQAFNAGGELCWTGPTAASCGSPPAGATAYTYDSRGNRTRVAPAGGTPTTLAYDQANSLTALDSTATYAYNGDGLRMSKTVGGTTSQNLWNVSSGIPLLLGDGATTYVDGPGGLPLEQITGSTVLYLHHDQLGSTRLLTTGTGTSAATYTFDPYGNLTASTGTVTNPFLFAGQYQDSESGLYFMRARYYDPGTGQFLSRDPLASLTRQPYSNVADDPLNATDPTGLDQNCSIFAFWASDWCAREGASTTTGKVVIAGGVVAAGIATGGLAFGWYGAAAGAGAGAEVDGTTIAPTLIEDAPPIVGAAGEGPASAGLQRQICDHLMKLNGYMQNPLDYDHTGRLANAINNGVGDATSIYDGRIAHLLVELRAFNSQ